jgi:hypothetical protein
MAIAKYKAIHAGVYPVSYDQPRYFDDEKCLHTCHVGLVLYA